MSEILGAWVVYSQDWNDIPEALFDNELDARRYVCINSEYHHRVAFCPWGSWTGKVDD